MDRWPVEKFLERLVNKEFYLELAFRLEREDYGMPIYA